jgi:hypothetical protein
VQGLAAVPVQVLFCRSQLIKPNIVRITNERIAEALSVNPLELFKQTNQYPEEEKAELHKKKTEILTILDKEIEKILISHNN